MDEVAKTAAAVRQFYRESLEGPDGSQRNLEKSFPLFIGDNTHNRVTMTQRSLHIHMIPRCIMWYPKILTAFFYYVKSNFEA